MKCRRFLCKNPHPPHHPLLCSSSCPLLLLSSLPPPEHSTLPLLPLSSDRPAFRHIPACISAHFSVFWPISVFIHTEKPWMPYQVCLRALSIIINSMLPSILQDCFSSLSNTNCKKHLDFLAVFLVVCNQSIITIIHAHSHSIQPIYIGQRTTTEARGVGP